MNAIFTIGIFLSLFLSFLLFTKKHKSLPDKILASWLTVIGLHLLSYFLYYQNYWTIYPHLIGITLPFPLLHGPLLYLYVLYSLRSDKSLRKRDYLHLAPAIGIYLYMIRFYFFYSPAEKIMVDTGQIDDFAVFSSILLVVFIISGLLYSILSYRKLYLHKRLIDSNFSSDERLSLDWLKYAIWGIGILFITIGGIVLLREGFKVSFLFNADLIFYSMIIVFVFCIGFFGIRHQDLFSNQTINSEKQLVQSPAGKEYKKSGLKEDLAQQKHQALLELMVVKKPYLNPKLTLIELAQQMDISPNHMSQIINQCEQKNFHDFVNQYRVEEFIQRAQSNNNFSLLAHALDSGFNSKSAFNSVFKKQQGLTPSQYIKSIKQNT